MMTIFILLISMLLGCANPAGGGYYGGGGTSCIAPKPITNPSLLIPYSDPAMEKLRQDLLILESCRAKYGRTPTSYIPLGPIIYPSIQPEPFRLPHFSDPAADLYRDLQLRDMQTQLKIDRLQGDLQNLKRQQMESQQIRPNSFYQGSGGYLGNSLQSKPYNEGGQGGYWKGGYFGGSFGPTIYRGGLQRMRP